PVSWSPPLVPTALPLRPAYGQEVPAIPTLPSAALALGAMEWWLIPHIWTSPSPGAGGATSVLSNEVLRAACAVLPTQVAFAGSVWFGDTCSGATPWIRCASYPDIPGGCGLDTHAMSTLAPNVKVTSMSLLSPGYTWTCTSLCAEQVASDEQRSSSR